MEVIAASIVTVDSTVAVSDIPDNGVRQMLEVSPNLMQSPCDRERFEEGASLLAGMFEGADPRLRGDPRTPLGPGDVVVNELFVPLKATPAHPHVALDGVSSLKSVADAPHGLA